jgi:hypothetical protein
MADRYPARIALTIVAAVGTLVLAGLIVSAMLDQRRAQRLDGKLQKVVNFLALSEHAKPHERFDAVRHFIHHNSHHGDDAEFRKLLGNRDLMAEEMIAYATGQRPEPIHLLCGARSQLMSAILEKLGYETRIVNLFDTDDDGLRSHTFLEVKNPETGRWEAQDPDYDLHWTHNRSAARISLTEAGEDLSILQPCHRHGACGWDLEDDEGKAPSKLRDYVDIICVTQKGERLCLFTSRAKPDRIFTLNDDRGRFCDLMPNRCTHGFHPMVAVQ